MIVHTRRKPSAAAAVLTAVPEADRARAFVGELRALIKGAAVAFARYDQNGTECETILADEHPAAVRQAEWLQAERLLQTRAQAPVPRLADPQIALDGLRGMVAVYGVEHTVFGLAILTRARAFTAEERTALDGTLRFGSELMRRLSTFEGEESAQERTAERAVPAQYVLARDYHIELSWIPPASAADDALQTILELSDGLPPVVEHAVRELTAGWTDDPATQQTGSAIPLPFMVVRTTPLRGPDGTLKIGVLVERFRSRNPLRHASEKFGMSSRELEVLALVLKGYGTPQIAASLDIAESTAHDHIKRMMLKTRARNRVELAAKALGWRGA